MSMNVTESMQAMAERRMIRSLTLALADAEGEHEREHTLQALADLVRHADPTLDPSMFDPWTRRSLERSGLWSWDGKQTS
jgi:hypothetical protein